MHLNFLFQTFLFNIRLREIDKQLQNLKIEDLCEITVSEQDIQDLVIATKYELEKQEEIKRCEINEKE